ACPCCEKDQGVRRWSRRQASAILSSTLFARPKSRRTGMEASQSRYGGPRLYHQPRRLQREGQNIIAFLATQSRQNPIVLPQTLPQICRLNVYILMYRSIAAILAGESPVSRGVQ